MTDILNPNLDELRAHDAHLTPILSGAEWLPARHKFYDWEVAPQTTVHGVTIPGKRRTNCTQIDAKMFQKGDAAGRLRAISELKAAIEAVINSDQTMDRGDADGCRPRRTAGLRTFGEPALEDIAVRFLTCFDEREMVDGSIMIVCEWGTMAW